MLAEILKDAAVGHFGTDMEAAVERALVRAGASRLKEGHLRRIEDGLPLGPVGLAFARNPRGTQASPDFVVANGGEVFELELKSGKGRAPLWNSGWPRRRMYYLLNFPALAAAPVLVPGTALVTAEMETALEAVSRNPVLREAQDWANRVLAEAGEGWTFFLRNMFNQQDFAEFFADGERLDAASADAAARLGPLDEPAHTPAAVEYCVATPVEHRRSLGQFFTPAPLGRRLARLVGEHLGPDAPPNTLEPAAGAGALAAVAVGTLGRDPGRLTLYETEPALAGILRADFPAARVRQADFLLFDEPRRFGLILANPPYVEGRAFDAGAWAEYKARYPELTTGRANVYWLFVVRCAELLEPGGLGAFILPTAFGSAPTAAAARSRVDALCEIVALEEVGMFDAGVGQEVALFLVRRRAGGGEGAGPGPFVRLQPDGPVFATPVGGVDWGACPTVAEVGCAVTTGALVWNQHKELMDPEPAPDSPLVVYSANIPAEGDRLIVGPDVRLRTRASPDKAQHLRPGSEARVRRGALEPPFVAVTRVAGRGKVRAVLVDAADPAVAGRAVFCENHVNVVTHPDVDVLRRVVASLRDPRVSLHMTHRAAGRLTMDLGQLRSTPVIDGAAVGDEAGDKAVDAAP